MQEFGKMIVNTHQCCQQNELCHTTITTQQQYVQLWMHEIKQHLKNVGPIRHCEPPHAHSPGVTTGTVTCRLHIDVDDNNHDNAWQGDRYGPIELAQ